MTPYRLEIAGGWADQRCVNSYGRCKVLTLSCFAEFQVTGRSGLASSTHDIADKLINDQAWHVGDINSDKRLAEYLWTQDGCGSQDSWGIACRGLNVLHYYDSDVPYMVESIPGAVWLEKNLRLLASPPRPATYNPITSVVATSNRVRNLDETTSEVIEAIMRNDIAGLSKALSDNFVAQVDIVPDIPRINLPFFNKWTGAGYGYYLSACQDVVGLPWRARI